MGSKSKPLRLKKKPKRQDSVKDRISELPDSILCHILSFIPTKYAVRTSILSTRWKSIWASVPNLDFEYKQRSVSGYAGFLTFVDHVLSFRDSLDIQKCRLHCYCRDEDFSRIDRWIQTVIRHNVVELDLLVKIKNNDEGGPILELPQCVFMCKTLVVLKVMSNCMAYTPPTSGCFPSLKYLHVSVDYPDNDSMEKVFSCCPVLECLTIDGSIGLYDALNFNISVPQLRTLRLELELDSVDDHDPEHTFFINCPKLESLDINQDVLLNYSFENVKSLVKANVNLWFHYAKYQTYFSDRTTALMAGFSNVKYLSLSAHFLEDQNCVDDFDEHKKYLKYILYSEHRWIKPESVPVCLISHLKTITIRGFKGYPHEKKVAKYLLKKGQVLSKMTICNDLSKEFAMSQRASKACQVEFI